MKHQYIDRTIEKVSRATLIIGMATTMVALPLATVSQASIANAATSASGEATITVTVDAVTIDIIKINGTVFGGSVEPGAVAVKTFNAKNDIHLRTDKDSKVQIIIGDKVLWEGETKAGQPVTATIDLTGYPVDVYKLKIKATADDGSIAEAAAWLDYQATLPSILPDGGVDAPNTGLYVTIGGRVYSMTTVAFLLILLALVIYLVSSRASKHEVAKAKTKSNKKAAN